MVLLYLIKDLHLETMFILLLMEVIKFINLTMIFQGMPDLFFVVQELLY